MKLASLLIILNCYFSTYAQSTNNVEVREPTKNVAVASSAKDEDLIDHNGSTLSYIKALMSHRLGIKLSEDQVLSIILDEYLESNKEFIDEMNRDYQVAERD